ncbi:MAG: FitA-like ribbon-helix-helix domain-containing protein [Terriglobia bacterium]
MANLTVRNIPEETYKRLQGNARQQRRSLNAEFLELLNDRDAWALRRFRIRSALPKLRRLRKEIAKKFPVKYEMLELIREGRESR